MKQLTFFVTLLVNIFVFVTIADEITLQQGLDNYDGCEDSYITKTNYSSFKDWLSSVNSGSQPELKVHYESC